MTTLTGSFRDVAGQPTRGTVKIYAAQLRPSTTAGQTVTREVWQGVLANGAFTAEGLEPGPAVVELHGASTYESLPVVLPESGAHDISALISEQVEWTPEVVEAAQLAAKQAAEKLAEVLAAANRVSQSEATVGGALQDVLRYSQAAGEASESARKDATAAGTARDEAVAAKDEAVAAKTESVAVRDEVRQATDLVDAANSVLEGMAGLEAQTRASAEAAASSASQAESHRKNASTQSNIAAGIRSQAQIAQKAAEAARDEAQAIQAELMAALVPQTVLVPLRVPDALTDRHDDPPVENAVRLTKIGGVVQATIVDEDITGNITRAFDVPEGFRPTEDYWGEGLPADALGRVQNYLRLTVYSDSGLAHLTPSGSQMRNLSLYGATAMWIAA